MVADPDMSILELRPRSSGRRPVRPAATRTHHARASRGAVDGVSHKTRQSRRLVKIKAVTPELLAEIEGFQPDT
jgi:hypothetical protein